MYDPDIDRLLDRSLAGEPADEAFRERVLRSSAAVLAAGERQRAWRYAVCAAAAILIAATAFLCGRASLPETTAVKTVPYAASDGQTVSVPAELVAWLEAARFFKQLDMPDRVSLAYEHAGRLVPRETPRADAGNATALAAARKKAFTILAQSFGG